MGLRRGSQGAEKPWTLLLNAQPQGMLWNWRAGRKALTGSWAVAGDQLSTGTVHGPSTPRTSPANEASSPAFPDEDQEIEGVNCSTSP